MFDILFETIPVWGIYYPSLLSIKATDDVNHPARHQFVNNNLMAEDLKYA
ncbi:MAG TPA: hypothetical protein VJU78_14845 [Chitinophagaceae bacterium]|nr:hypothetical protein [Chitinophagaceae bacterium]